MEYFGLGFCILFSGVVSGTILKRSDSSKDGKDSPLIWVILQQINALGARLEKLRDVAHENQKEVISMKRDILHLKSKDGNLDVDEGGLFLEETSYKRIAVKNKKKIDHLKEKLDKFDSHKLGRQIKEMKQLLSQMKNLKGGGGIYIRWGRTTCPSNGTELLYSGYTGGGYAAHYGAPAEPVCLPTNPNFLKKSGSGNAFIYGTEFETNFFGSNSVNHDVPCSVCYVQYGTTVMIPGRTTCTKRWKVAYVGNLAAGNAAHAAASAYLCVDLNPEYTKHGRSNQIGYMLYEVIGQCGSLPCPPYRHGYPLPCVVCTK